jgi:hypothetical protein
MCEKTTCTRPLNTYSEITIKGTRYKIHSIFDGEKSFQNLMEDLIVMKASHPKKAENDHIEDCEGNDIAV